MLLQHPVGELSGDFDRGANVTLMSGVVGSPPLPPRWTGQWTFGRIPFLLIPLPTEPEIACRTRHHWPRSWFAEEPVGWRGAGKLDYR